MISRLPLHSLRRHERAYPCCRCCSPSNPTGSVYSAAELQALVDVIARYPDVLVIADEIYEHINYTHKPFTSLGSFPELAGRVVIINGVSKRVCHDRLAHRLLRRTCRDCQGCHQASGTIYLGRVVHSAEAPPRLPTTLRRTVWKRCAEPLSAVATWWCVLPARFPDLRSTNLRVLSIFS